MSWFGVGGSDTPESSRKPSFARGSSEQVSAGSSLFFSPLLSEPHYEWSDRNEAMGRPWPAEYPAGLADEDIAVASGAVG
jgi:hypothetical protein